MTMRVYPLLATDNSTCVVCASAMEFVSISHAVLHERKEPSAGPGGQLQCQLVNQTALVAVPFVAEL